MNDFTVKPVPEFPAYYVGPGGQVMGVPADSATAQDLIPVNAEMDIEGDIDGDWIPADFKPFFALDGELYFELAHTFPPEEEGGESETVTKYCKQSGGVISYLTEAKFPTMPDPARAEGAQGDYVFTVGDYKGQAYSSAKRGDDPEERIIFIDGSLEVAGGILVHVKENGHPSRPPGLLYWPKNKTSMMFWKDPGRFWMM